MTDEIKVGKLEKGRGMASSSACGTRNSPQGRKLSCGTDVVLITFIPGVEALDLDIRLTIAEIKPVFRPKRTYNRVVRHTLQTKSCKSMSLTDSVAIDASSTLQVVRVSEELPDIFELLVLAHVKLSSTARSRCYLVCK